eukprot:7982252-Pyramimonas_sp.AAC.2
MSHVPHLQASSQTPEEPIGFREHDQQPRMARGQALSEYFWARTLSRVKQCRMTAALRAAARSLLRASETMPVSCHTHTQASTPASARGHVNGE